MIMVMAAAAATTTTTIINAPLRALETASNGGGRQIRLLPLPLRSDSNPAQLFRSLNLISPTRNCSDFHVVSCLPSPRLSNTPFNPSTKLFVSGLSFRTTEESLRNAFKSFGQLLEVTLVMDKIANRPKGFAFIRYATEEESQKAIEGMHGKFLDGRVIFVEVAKSRSELRQSLKQNSRQT